jgi:hypothetical protein
MISIGLTLPPRHLQPLRHPTVLSHTQRTICATVQSPILWQTLPPHSNINPDSDGANDDDFECSTAYTHATDDITMPPYDFPGVVITLPADREHSFLYTSPNNELLDVKSWDFPATLSILLDLVGATGLCAAPCSNWSFRQRWVTTFAQTREYDLRVPSSSVLNSARISQRKICSSQEVTDAEVPEREPSAHHGLLVNGSFAECRNPFPNSITPSIQFYRPACSPIHVHHHTFHPMDGVHPTYRRWLSAAVSAHADRSHIPGSLTMNFPAHRRALAQPI